MATYENLHQQSLAICTNDNLKYHYEAYLLHRSMTIYYVVWNYLCDEIF